LAQDSHDNPLRTGDQAASSNCQLDAGAGAGGRANADGRDRTGHDIPSAGPFIFPKWTNRLREASAVAAVGGIVYLVVLIGLLFSPQTTAIGYAPEQPIPYSHALHAGQLGIDCRYCHNTVEWSAHAAVPPTQTCLNCHRHIRTESPKLLLVRESEATGMSIDWVRIHDLPDFAYFDHSAHLTAGVGCVSCHGRIDKMEVVRQAMPLTMGWCLDCHRNPDANLRPQEFLTAMDWTPEEDPAVLGRRLREAHSVRPSTDCSTCHR
jgi:hypothetical protein